MLICASSPMRPNTGVCAKQYAAATGPRDTIMVELLSPAGSLEKLEYALAYGADAVYVGGSKFSLRATASNFSLQEIKTASEIVKKADKKLYVALNIFAHQADMGELKTFLEGLSGVRPDALIIADAGVFSLAKEICPGVALHVSTQANVTNLEAAKFWAEAGAKRITLARELTLDEISEITTSLPIETEVFIHGAMCLSYSGRCWLSHHLAGRDANRGDCAQSCRWDYALVEEKRPEEALRVFEDGRGSYILSSKDLCLAEEIPLLIKAGVSSFKIEGRMKSTHYVATVTKVYREIIDTVGANNYSPVKEKQWLGELEKISHRQYSKGFIIGNGDNLQVAGRTSYMKTAEFLGAVEEQTAEGCKVKVKNRLLAGDELEVLAPAADNKKTKACFYDENGDLLTEAHANSVVYFKEKWPPLSLIRRKIEYAQMANA